MNDPPVGCSASAITETLLHSTVSLSGKPSTEMGELLDLLGSSLILSGAIYLAVGTCAGVALIAATHTNSHVNTMVSMVTGSIVVTGQGEGEPWLSQESGEG